MKKKFKFDEVPEGYLLCFNAECDKHDDCLRYLAGQHVPPVVMGGPAVYPNAYKDGICPYFKKTRTRSFFVAKSISMSKSAMPTR